MNYQKTGRDERLFEKLALEHFDEMLNSDIRFLLARGLHGGLPGGSLLLLEGEQLLLLLDANFIALLQSELGVLAVDTLSIYR